MLETISNYPKLSRASIIFRIEVGYLALQTLFGLVVFGIIMYQVHQVENYLGKTSDLDYWSLVGALILISLSYFVEAGITVLLYKGIQTKDYKKLVLWVFVHIGLWLFYAVTVLLEVIDRKSMGNSAYILTLLFLIYRSVAIKVVCDAIQELRKFPMTVPFVNMRDCEDRV